MAFEEFPLRVLVQRVKHAVVRVAGEPVGRIGSGLLVFVGVERGDGIADADYLADKTVALRIFPDAEGKMNRSVAEADGEILVVSQFTLAASTRRGRRPSFARAEPPDSAEPLYERFQARLRGRGIPVATGRFQAMMEVESLNDGPVTLLLDPPPWREEA